MFPFSPLQYVSATERKINRVEGERGREAVGRRPGERAWLLICPSPWGRGSPGQSRTGEGLRGGPGGQAHPRRRYVGAAAPAGGSGAEGPLRLHPKDPRNPLTGTGRTGYRDGVRPCGEHTCLQPHTQTHSHPHQLCASHTHGRTQVPSPCTPLLRAPSRVWTRSGAEDAGEGFTRMPVHGRAPGGEGCRAVT